MRTLRLLAAAMLGMMVAGCSSGSPSESDDAAAKRQAVPTEVRTAPDAGESGQRDVAAALEALENESEARQAAGVEFFFLSQPLDAWAHVAEVEPEAVLRSPEWRADAESPPLPARKALELADAYVREEYDLQNAHGVELERELRGITLVPYPGGLEEGEERGPGRRWLWVVSYEWHLAPGENVGSTGEPLHIAVPVLMDGTVVPVARKGEAAEHPAGTGLF